MSRATHHGPWCEEGPLDEQCLTCSPFAPDQGWWLFAKLAVHHFYNRALAKNRQEPIEGLELRAADHIEVMHLIIALETARDTTPRRL